MLLQFAKQKPKDPDGILKVILLGRVSTTHQQMCNIQAGYVYARQILKNVHDGDCLVKELGDCASGMRTDRPSIIEAERLIEDGWPDLVLMEDLSKAYRNPRHQYEFVQDAVDKRVRVIAVGDNLDTYDENWEVALSAATMQHGTHIPHTRRRVRRTATDCFHRGGMVMRVRFGYRKLSKAEAASGQFGTKGLRLVKQPEWTETILRVRDMVVNEVATGKKRIGDIVDYLNDNNVPTGPYVEKRRWNRRVLLDLLRSPILYGGRSFRQIIYQYQYKTGKHLREKNANPEAEYVPELAHMSREQWDELKGAIDTLKNGRKNPIGSQHVRFRVARNRTVCPLQHATCIVCGAFCYLCADGVMKCKEALPRYDATCWNHVHVECDRARKVLLDIALYRIEQYPHAREIMLDEAWNTVEKIRSRSDKADQGSENEIELLERQASHLTKAIKMGADLPQIVEESRTIQKAIEAARGRQEERRRSAVLPRFPSCREEFCANPRETLLELARTSYEFGDLMRRIFPKFQIQPVQALDCFLVRPRAHLILDLAALCSPDAGTDQHPLPQEIVADMFEPPAHIKHLPAILALMQSREASNERTSLDALAAELKIGRMTVRRALAYGKLMDAAGTTEPYRVLTERPQTASRWKRRSSPVCAAKEVPGGQSRVA